MNIVIESEMGRIQDLPSKEWNHSILDRKCKRPECRDQKRNPTELRYHYSRAHPLDIINFTDEDMNRCYKCGTYIKSKCNMKKHQTTNICRDLHDRNRRIIQNKLIKSSQRQIFTVKRIQ